MTPDDQHVAAPGLEQHRTAVAEIWGKFCAVHGPRHILDGAAPAIGFLLGYSVAGAEIGVFIAILIAVALAAIRLIQGDTVRVVAISVLVILVLSLFVEITGEGRGFYLPEVALCVVMTVLFGATLLIGKPLSYTVSRRIRLEPADPADPAARLRLHRRITLAWFVFWPVHVVVMLPLYLADKVVILGTVALILGKPALVVMLAATWLWVRATREQPATRAEAV
ncbi:DUF3159 domain-containing protein [Nocardia sp. NBC_00565]|uniref:DUF3159 domain-containing protein n=1 Tax=Nocardia sp. NBC_00565 TaxID=2975993 RepID=UPI002E80B90D|nr:DUF3159 domain-containing protein [Nocardia sp. NBC_00565]WUB99957.1 DUF3159 domain-containing protein [Nocardia sp. NBC_00565]